MNAISATAAAITDAINEASASGALSQKVTAVRRWLPVVTIEELNAAGGIFVLVVPKAFTSTIANRSNDFDDVEIDVGYLTKLSANADEVQADTVFDLIEQIHGVLRRGFDVPNAAWQERRADPLFDVAMMEQQRVLRAATTYRFKVYHNVVSELLT